MEEDEAATVKTLATYCEIMSSLIRQHRGRVVDSPGDNVLAEFSSVVDVDNLNKIISPPDTKRGGCFVYYR
jgi:class 3 adenylate cyclase